MALLPLVIAPDPILKQKSAPVEAVTDEVRQLLDDMLETMYHAAGIGLAAVQVGILKRLVVIDIHWRDDAETSRAPLKLINPEIVGPSGEDAVYKEGCLSFPEQFSEVTRPANVLVRYLNEWGERQEMKVDGLLATCVQHEIDHTDGITFVDHLSPLKRKLIMSKLKKRKRQAEHHVHDAHCHHD